MSFDDFVFLSGNDLLRDIANFYSHGKYIEAGERVRYIMGGFFREHHPDLPESELKDIETKAWDWGNEIPLCPNEIHFE